MSFKSENKNDGRILATFEYSHNLMLDALREFLQTIHEGGVEPKGEQVKYTLAGYLVEALAVTVATSSEVGDGEDFAYIIGGHAARRITERMREKWYHDLKEEAQAKCKDDDAVLANLKPQGRA